MEWGSPLPWAIPEFKPIGSFVKWCPDLLGAILLDSHQLCLRGINSHLTTSLTLLDPVTTPLSSKIREKGLLWKYISLSPCSIQYKWWFHTDCERSSPLNINPWSNILSRKTGLKDYHTSNFPFLFISPLPPLSLLWSLFLLAGTTSNDNTPCQIHLCLASPLPAAAPYWGLEGSIV